MQVKADISCISKVLMIVFATMSFSNCTAFGYIFKDYRVWWIILVGVILLNRGIFYKNCRGLDIYVLLLLILAINFIVSPYKEQAYLAMSVYVFCLFVYMMNIQEGSIAFFIKLCYAISIFIACTIVVEVFIPTFTIDHLWFFGSPYAYELAALRAFKLAEIGINAYSGIAFEKADAAYYMLLGICALCATYKRDHSLKISQWLTGVLFIACIFLTGKRMLLLCAIAVILISFSIMSDNNKLIKVIGIAILAIITVIVLSNFVPAINNMLNRFGQASSGNDSALLERYIKWENAFTLFKSHLFLGTGYSSYNVATQEIGYQASFFVHNIYIQLLSDTGIIGFIGFILFSAINMFRTWRFLYRRRGSQDNRRESYVLTFGLTIQALILIYGISGNTIFYIAQLFMYLFSVIMSNRMMDEIESDEWKEYGE